MSLSPQLLTEFVDAMSRCRMLYQQGALADPQDDAGQRQSLEDLHAGLLVKIYTAFSLADGRWQAQERPLGAALVRHLWRVQLEGERLKKAVMRLTTDAAKLSWYSVLRPFAELPPLREKAPELEIVALQLAKLVAAADGPIQPAELNMLQTLQNELETHLQPLSFDTASTTTPPPGRHVEAAPALARPGKRVDTRPPVGSCHPQEIPDEAAPLTSLLLRLRSLTGLEHVKSEIESLANLIRFQQQRAQWQLPTSPLNLHMVFTGNPGTGKTTVARLVGEILKAMGILTRGHLIETDRAGLVAEYAGQTAPKTNRLIDTALNGILFIDEAYGLLTHNDDAYGHEAIQTLVKRMEDDRHRLVVILAGYEAPMRQLLLSNPGLSSRFNRFLTFSDYLPDELLEIFLHFCERNQFQMPPNVRARLITGLTLLYQQRDEHFGNGRLVRNVFENAIRSLANRLARDPTMSHEALTTFQCDDITFGSLQEADVAARLDTLRVISPCPACGKRVRQRVATLGATFPCPHCRRPHRFEWGEVTWSAGPLGR